MRWLAQHKLVERLQRQILNSLLWLTRSQGIRAALTQDRRVWQGATWTDLAALADAHALQRLNLAGNAVTDVSVLAGLRNLRVLDLSDNAIEDVGPLAGLVELRRLNLSGNRLRDIGPLAELTNLEVLLLDGNVIVDIGPLTHGTTASQPWVIEYVHCRCKCPGRPRVIAPAGPSRQSCD